MQNFTFSFSREVRSIESCLRAIKAATKDEAMGLAAAMALVFDTDMPDDVTDDDSGGSCDDFFPDLVSVTDEPPLADTIFPGEFERSIMAGYQVEKTHDGYFYATDAAGERVGQYHEERTAWQACDNHRMFGVTYDGFLKQEAEQVAEIAAEIVEAKPVEIVSVFVVQGVHWDVPGAPMSAHFTEQGAAIAASGLVNTMLADLELPAMATAENWPSALNEVQAKLLDKGKDEESGDVWITTVPISGLSPAPLSVNPILKGAFEIAEAVDAAHVLEDAIDDFEPCLAGHAVLDIAIKVYIGQDAIADLTKSAARQAIKNMGLDDWKELRDLPSNRLIDLDVSHLVAEMLADAMPEGGYEIQNISTTATEN